MKKQVGSKRPFLIGLFVITATIILIGAIFWLGANEFLRQQQYHATYFSSSVEGLEKGSPVKYQGVPVGSVENISLAPGDKIIQVIMQIDQGINLSDSLLRVKLAMAGIAGGKFLQLHYNENPVLLDMHPEIDFAIPDNVISCVKSAPSDIDEISIAAQNVMNNLKTLEVGKISRSTLGMLESSTEFLDTATSFLSTGELRNILKNLDSSSASMRIFLAKLESSPVVDDVRETANNLYMTSQYLKNFTVRLNEQIDSMRLVDNSNLIFLKYDTVMTTLSGSVENLSFLTGSLLLEMGETLSEIQATNRKLAKVISKINSQPGTILSDSPPEEK